MRPSTGSEPERLPQTFGQALPLASSPFMIRVRPSGVLAGAHAPLFFPLPLPLRELNCCGVEHKVSTQKDFLLCMIAFQRKP